MIIQPRTPIWPSRAPSEGSGISRPRASRSTARRATFAKGSALLEAARCCLVDVTTRPRHYQSCPACGLLPLDRGADISQADAPPAYAAGLAPHVIDGRLQPPARARCGLFLRGFAANRRRF